MPTAERVQEQARLEAVITGLVQGVNFRWFTQRQAAALGLVGYVQNRDDGAVHLIAEGPRSHLVKLLEQVRVGPSSAIIEEVQVHWAAPRSDFADFRIRY